MSEDTKPEINPQEDPSIGDLLRTEREKKGISKSDLAETIKVRESVIDAIENEEWDKLPARVFVKGFIRSYTISIGYDTTKALRLFDKSMPAKREEPPATLTGIKKKSPAMYYYAVPVFIIILAAVYLFTTGDKADRDNEYNHSVSETSLDLVESSTEKSVSGVMDSAENAITEEIKKTAEGVMNRANTAVEKTSEHEEKAAPQVAESQTSEEKSDKTSETAFLEKISSDEIFISEQEAEDDTVSNDPPAALLTLSAAVNMSTYVRIIVDDNEPKEYVFQPGSRPDWTAERGFEVKVGNAAGIEFEFNGEKFENLGDIGKVKTLRFPKDFKTNWEEEQ